jgi:Mrp family chromosome partitioning ATPase
MPAVSEPGGSGDLIARRFFVLLRQASIRYDLIVVDCPPLLIGDAGRTLVRLADSALFVVGTGVGVRQLEEGNGILRTLQVPVLGAVINRAPRSEVEGGYRQARRYGLRSERSAEPS